MGPGGTRWNVIVLLLTALFSAGCGRSPEIAKLADNAVPPAPYSRGAAVGGPAGRVC